VTNRNNKVVKGIQINLRKSGTATVNMLKKCEKLSSYILFSQEPQIINGKMYLNKIKTHYQTQVGDLKTRAAIGHSGDLDIFNIPDLTSRDVCTCMWNRNDINLIIISAYWDGLVNTIPASLLEAINYANNNKHQYILCIDANAHSTTWGSHNDNLRGRIFEDLIAENNMRIHNTFNQPTYQTTRNGRLIQSTIDLTLTTNRYDNPIYDWKTSASYEGSDHRMIHFCIDKPKTDKKLVYNYANCKWTNFTSELDNVLWPELATQWNNKAIDEEADLLTSNIIKALDTHYPKNIACTRVKN
jgi:hypothetical protein